MNRITLMITAMALLVTGACKTATSGDEKIMTGRDARFVAYENQTVKDQVTGLMWAAQDNGGPISCNQAKKFCKNYRGGGYDDWRMPTTEELKAIYNPDIINPYAVAEGCKGPCHITPLIHLNCCAIWSWDGITEVETFFHFNLGPKDWRDQSLTHNHPRALPVRDARHD